MNKRDIFILIGLGFVSNVLVAATRASIPDFLMLSLISFGGAMMGGGITALLRGSSFESSVMVDIVEELMEKFKKDGFIIEEIAKKVAPKTEPEVIVMPEAEPESKPEEEEVKPKRSKAYTTLEAMGLRK